MRPGNFVVIIFLFSLPSFQTLAKIILYIETAKPAFNKQIAALKHREWYNYLGHVNYIKQDSEGLPDIAKIVQIAKLKKKALLDIGTGS